MQRMSDTEMVKKMLRAVLQSKKNGVFLTQLQSEYRSLTGEIIPYRKMGYASLEGLLHSMPSIVRMECGCEGEVVCFAAVCHETSHIARLVAWQRSSKKAGGSQLVNCQMRVRLASPFELNAKPRTSLRQPDHKGNPGLDVRHPSLRGCPGGYQLAGTWKTRPEKKMPQNDAPSLQTRNQPMPCERPKMTLSPRIQKELNTHVARNPRKAPASDPKVSPVKPRTPQSIGYDPQVVQDRLKEVLNKHSHGFWVSKLPQLYRELYKQDLPCEALNDLEHWSHVCVVEKTCCSNPSERLLYPPLDPQPVKVSRLTPVKTTPVSQKHSQLPISPVPTSALPTPPPTPPSPLPTDIKQKLGELLVKYSSGIWAHALPRLFQDAYKTSFPERWLADLSLLGDICTVEYPMAENTKKAILYARAAEPESGGKSWAQEVEEEEEEVTAVNARLSPPTVPPLSIPAEEYPSVLVVEAGSTNSVVLRYVGEGYSQAQEALEDKMQKFYSMGMARKELLSPATGQLTAVRVEEEEEEVLRARVCEVEADMVKVYYVDHGFAEVVSRTKLMELHQEFTKLPFQAARCRLAGLEPFCREPAVLKTFESLACGKILLAEILERGETPLMVLYDTSHNDDLNINAACVKALQEKHLEISLQVDATYTNVNVTNVCSDGSIVCQLPSPGRGMLERILEKTEAYFNSQVTSEFLVSQPFCGKFCLAQYRGRWSRVEVTNLHGRRVLDVQFVDLGFPASLEVIELREIPPPFLHDLITIPPQVVKCSLVDLPLNMRPWTPDAVLWLRDAVLNSTNCSIKVAKLAEAEGLAQVYLFASRDTCDIKRSINHQMATSDLCKLWGDLLLSGGGAPAEILPRKPQQPETRDIPATPPLLPPALELPRPGHNVDIYVPVACHPGHFVLQPWKDLYKLVVLMGEMILYYNKTEERLISVEKNQIYAAKVENNWHRVLVKGVLTNGLVSVYELDYGRHELVSNARLQPLIEEFRQLPFQGVTAQLAGVKPRHWSEEASIVFRNHVEKKPLVAQIEAVHEGPQPWDRKVEVYLVDTSLEEEDIWVHNIMSEFAEVLTT